MLDCVITVVEILVVGFTVLVEVDTTMELEPSLPVVVLVRTVVLVVPDLVILLVEVDSEVPGSTDVPLLV